MADFYAMALNAARVHILTGEEAYDDSEFPPVPITGAMVREMLFGDLYGALLDAFTPPMPRDVQHTSEVSALMLKWGAPDTAKALGQFVQRWRDDARAKAHQDLRRALLKIESEMNGNE